MFAFVVGVLISYAVGAASALPAEEVKSTDMALLSVASYAGVLLVANDGIRDRERFRVLVRRIAVMGGLYACVGLVQFFSGENIVDSFQIPGLTSSGSGGIDVRGGFLRPEATARHALEYASVLSMVLPLAVTLTLARPISQVFRRSWPAAAVALAAVVSVTRSALLGVVVGVGILVPSWDARIRRAALAVGAVALLGMYFLVPGLAGTILGMFSGDDPSLRSRTASYDVFWSYFSVRPVFGRGLGSLSASYHIFDNQFVGLLIETGVVGTALFCLLVMVAVITAYRSRFVEGISGFGPATAGMVLAGTLLCAFFDAFHFPQAVGMLFLGLGMCGALGNLKAFVSRAGRSRGHAQTQPGQTLVRILVRRWYIFASVALLTIPVALSARAPSGVYYTKVTVEFQAPPGATKDNPLRTEPWSLVGYAAIIQRLYGEGSLPPGLLPNSAPLYGTGLTDGEAVYLRNNGGQWQSTFDVPLIDVEVVGHTALDVTARAQTAAAQLVSLTPKPQEDIGVDRQAQITAVQRPLTPAVIYVPPRPRNALLAWIAAIFGTAVCATLLVDRSLDSRAARRLRSAARELRRHRVGRGRAHAAPSPG